MKRALVVVAVLGGCKEKSKPVPVEVTPPKPAVPVADFRTSHTLTATPKGSAFEIADGTGQFHLTLPGKPQQMTGDMMSQGGVEVWNAQAVMPGGDVDVQFGAMAVPDGDLPPDLSVLDSVPDQLAQASGGTVAKNEAGSLAGVPARVFELTTPDKRRLFGWYIPDHTHGRMYQINCVGDDTPKTRTACGAVASSFAFGS
jgi:hypothetical protein